MADRVEGADKERREFVRKSLYVAPAILTLQAYSAVAKAGSVKPDLSTKFDRFEQRSAKFEQKLEQRTQRSQDKRAEKREKFESKFRASQNAKGPKDTR